MTTMNNEDPADPSVHEPRVLDAGVGRLEPERAEPAWAQQCRKCANLRQQRGGRIWKCLALRVGHRSGWPEMGYCADARAPGGVCGPEGRAYLKAANVAIEPPVLRSA